MTNTKRFPLRVLLTVTTERLLTEGRGEHDNGIGDLYDILGWMTDDSPFTHQLPRFGRECQPYLLKWFPELSPANACLASLDAWIKKAPTCPDEGIKMWLAELKAMFPDIRDSYDVLKIPRETHATKGPVEELAEMLGGTKKIVVVNT